MKHQLDLTGPKSKKQFILQFFIALCIIYSIPYIKNIFFPDQMTQLEKMLRNSTLMDCIQKVKRDDRVTILLTIEGVDRPPVTTVIYRDVIQELEPQGDRRVFFAHAINRNSDGVFYLSQTRIEADPDLKKVRLLEMTVCDRIKEQTGRVPYDGRQPIYECEVPIQQVTCVGEE